MNGSGLSALGLVRGRRRRVPSRVLYLVKAVALQLNPFGNVLQA